MNNANTAEGIDAMKLKTFCESVQENETVFSSSALFNKPDTDLKRHSECGGFTDSSGAFKK
jgi:hypothetical protein